MLTELHVRELGVIADLDVVLGAGLTALTGETGAGKTLLVDALGLLLGGRAEPDAVRSGAAGALVEGRFVNPASGEEMVLARSVPAIGRSRAYVDGRMAPVTQLAEVGHQLVELFSQHDHQALLQPGMQRRALDRFAGVDLGPVRELRRQMAELDDRITSLGGDERARARELDLLRFEAAEIAALAISHAGEDDELEREEEVLASAAELRAAVGRGHALLAGDGTPGAIDFVGDALGAVAIHGPLDELAGRLRSTLADLDDVATELRRCSDRFEEDPERLEGVRARRQRLHAVVRKHGEHLADVLAAEVVMRQRIEELDRVDETRTALETKRIAVAAELVAHERAVGDLRRSASSRLARAVEAHLADLALGRARLEIQVPPLGAGDAVEFQLAANPGEELRPLAKAASGGELARTMLALRLVLTADQPTLVFDEVDAGIGGEAALAVGRALAELARSCQVLVVTHLAQVAAHADRQIAVVKIEEGGRTQTGAHEVEGEERLAELSRMLSGHPESAAARDHAAELLDSARPGRSTVRVESPSSL